MSVLDSGKCQFIDGISLEESEDKVFNINAPVIARMKKKEDLIDFAGPHCKVFQVTVSECHNFSLRGLKKLLVAAGHCSMVEGKLKLVDKVVGKTAFYWVVPNEREGLWKQKAPLRIGKENENEALLERAQRMELASFLEKCFDQYVLVMDNVPIEPSDNLLEETDSARQEVAEPDMSTAMKKHYNKLRRMTKIELRALCHKFGLNDHGFKDDLIRRLLPHVKIFGK